MIEKVTDGKNLLAIIIRKKNYPKKIGANFISGHKDSLQLGFINYPTKHIIKPHLHLKKKNNWHVSRSLNCTKGYFKCFFL